MHFKVKVHHFSKYSTVMLGVRKVTKAVRAFGEADAWVHLQVLLMKCNLEKVKAKASSTLFGGFAL